LNKIIDLFGTSIFFYTNIDDQTEFELKKHGFTTEDNYQSVFKFELTPKGFTATSKYFVRA
jgi:hypothetical protein